MQCVVVYFYVKGAGGGVFAVWLSTFIILGEKIISKLSGIL